MITSSDNKRIKDICRLASKKRERLSRGLFIAEGERIVAEAPGDRVESIFCTEAFAEAHPGLLIPGKTEKVSEAVFAKMSDTETPQGVIAVVKMQKSYHKLQDLLSGLSSGDDALILFLEDIRDPGNLGTIIRSAEAAGVTGVVMSKDTVDIYSPKTVRSTMGSIYRVPFFYAEDFRAELESAKMSGIRLYAAYLDSSISYYAADFTGACGILIGSEATGLSGEAAAIADERIIIPMQGRVESLNAAMAASIIMFEARRQRLCGK